MDYKNGFYTFIPTPESMEDMTELSIPQVIEIIEGDVWLTGMSEQFDIDYVNALGVIGKMVMSQDGRIILTTKEG